MNGISSLLGTPLAQAIGWSGIAQRLVALVAASWAAALAARLIAVGRGKAA